MKISAVIIAKDEARHIVASIESVAFCDEVLVVDSGSTDATVALARGAGARVVVTDWPGYVAQKNRAASLASHDWVLSLDADERVDAALRARIEALRAAGEPDVAAFEVRRHTYYLGRWIDHGGWYPEWRARLFDRRRAHWGGVDPHDRIEAKGPVGRITAGDLEHRTYDSIAGHVRQIDRFTTIAAREKLARGRRGSLLAMLVRPPWCFFRMYVLRLGFLDGRPGFVIAKLSAHYVFLKYAKVWEGTGYGRESRPVRDVRHFDASGFRLVTADVAEGPARVHLLPDPSAVAASGVTIHANLYRAASRVEVPGLGSMLMKVHRPHGAADRLRSALRVSRARAEWDAARFLGGAGVPTPEPLVLAERRHGVALVCAVTASRFLTARETFAPALRAQPPALARALLVRAARWIRAMHDRGTSHGDLHSGNVLVGPGPGDRAEIHVVDLHTVRTARTVPRRTREAQLARWLHSLVAITGPGGRLRSLLAYTGGGLSRAQLAGSRARVERLLDRRERTRVRSRSRRCVEEGGTFTKELGEAVGWRRRDFALSSLETALAAHDRSVVERDRRLLKAGRKGVVTRTPCAIVKERLAPTLSRRLEARVLGRRLRRGYENAHGLEVRGFATASPLAFVRRGRRTFTLYRDLSAFPRLDHRVRDALRTGDWSRRRLREVGDALADLAARLHRRGIWHGDWKACNFLIEERGRPVVFHLIDTDRVRFQRAVTLGQRMRNLAQLSASLPQSVSRTDRLRWFRRYARATPLAARRAERAALAAVALLASKKIVVVDEPIE